MNTLNRLHLTIGSTSSSGCECDGVTGDVFRLPDWTADGDLVEPATTCVLANLLPSGRWSFLLRADPLSPLLIRW